jgi:hypothetical protein
MTCRRYRPTIGASIEFARRPLVLAPERPPIIPLPIHKAYSVILPVLPVIAEAEACAEKLARYRRTALGRDVYDLAQFASRPVDERLVRRLWVLKVWADVVDDGRGRTNDAGRPAIPATATRSRSHCPTEASRVGDDRSPGLVVLLVGIALEGDRPFTIGKAGAQELLEFSELAVGQGVHRVHADGLGPGLGPGAEHGVHDRDDVGEALARPRSRGQHVRLPSARATSIASAWWR